MAVQTKDRKVSKMTRTNNKQAKHMNQNVAHGGNKRRVAVVALAIAGVLAVGGVSAVCVAGLGKSPGQAPAAAQTTTAQKATPANTTTKAKAATSAKATPAKTEAKQAEKPAQQQPAKAEAKPAQPTQQQAQPAKTQAQPAKQQTQPAKQQTQQQAQPSAPAQQQTQQPAQQQVQQPAQPQPQAEQTPGMEAQVSREQCIAIACAHVGAAGAAKGEDQNVKTRGPVTGGGTIYYEVELDLGDVHYSVTVDATTGHVIGADQTHAGTRTLLDSEGNPVEGTEWPVSA